MFKIFSTVALACLISGCISLKAPQVKGIDKVSFTELSPDMKMMFNLNVHNPNNYGVNIKRMNVKVFLDDSLISKIGLAGKQKIAASSNIALPFEVQPKLANFPKLALAGITEIFSNSGSKLKMEGEIVVSKFIFRKRYSFSVPKK